MQKFLLLLAVSLEITLPQQASAEHAQAIADYEELTRRSQAIPPQIELLTRYEKHINRTLYEALDRLKVRQQAGSVGSFGYKIQQKTVE
jgi:hypothetical protein